MTPSFFDTLWKSARDNKSIACMGLDPVIAAMPDKFSKHGIDAVPNYFFEIFEEMRDQGVLAGAFKPNQGFYTRHDRPLEGKFSGSKALAKVLNTLKQIFPETPIILDNKRGDIGKSSANYAAEGFESWGADAVTVHPYMGTDSVMPFIEKGAAYILTRTSNPGAEDFQNRVIGRAEETGIGREVCLYETVALKIAGWARKRAMDDDLGARVGSVVGATYPKELGRIVEIYKGLDIPLLIPGVGGQGGSAKVVMDILRKGDYDLALGRINSSSGLTHPWAKKKESAPEDYAKVCVEALKNLNESIGFEYKAR